MILENGHLTPSALRILEENADLVQCECPTYLIGILAKVREFHHYTTDCITRFPEDGKTHAWLQKSAMNIDAMLSSTIVQLARMEGFINDQNEFVPREDVGNPD